MHTCFMGVYVCIKLRVENQNNRERGQLFVTASKVPSEQKRGNRKKKGQILRDL